MATPSLLSLGVTTLQQRIVPEAAAAIFHTIILCRALGPLDGWSADNIRVCKRLQVSYRTSGVRDIDLVVEDAIFRLESALATTNAAEVLLTFYERKEKPALFGFTTNVERVMFEQWKWQIRQLPQRKPSFSGPGASVGNPDDAKVRGEMADAVRRLMLDVAVAAAEDISHIPSIPADAAATVPYGIVIDVKAVPLTPLLAAKSSTSSPSLPPLVPPVATASPPTSTKLPAQDAGRSESRGTARSSRSSSLSLGDMLDNVLPMVMRRGSRPSIETNKPS